MYLGGYQKQSGYFGKENYLMPLLEIEQHFLGCPALRLVTILSESQ